MTHSQVFLRGTPPGIDRELSRPNTWANFQQVAFERHDACKQIWTNHRRSFYPEQLWGVSMPRDWRMSYSPIDLGNVVPEEFGIQSPELRACVWEKMLEVILWFYWERPSKKFGHHTFLSFLCIDMGSCVFCLHVSFFGFPYGSSGHSTFPKKFGGHHQDLPLPRLRSPRGLAPHGAPGKGYPFENGGERARSPSEVEPFCLGQGDFVRWGVSPLEVAF